MSFIKDFEDLLKKELGNKDIRIIVSSKLGSYSVTDQESDIFKVILQESSRIVDCPVNFRIVYDQTLFISFNISEFPACCGKLILHTLLFNRLIYSNQNPYKAITISDEMFGKIMPKFFDLIMEICNRLRYSSLDFILSLEEQPKILENVLKMGLKETYKFTNYRSNKTHTCFNFSMDVNVGWRQKEPLEEQAIH